jgi:uncharacterized protein YndB with AHSA1/START domain
MAVVQINLAYNGCSTALKNKRIITKKTMMELAEKTIIMVQAIINAPIEAVWKYWTTPEDIVEWNTASEDWHTTRAENNLRAGGNFIYRMEAKDGSAGFDFAGVYDKVIINEQIDYTLGDGRKVIVKFSPAAGKVRVVESFEAENTYPVEMQRSGWQAILDNFNKYTKTHQK